MKRHFAIALAAFASLASQSTLAQVEAENPQESQSSIALMGTIPIFWGEARGIDDLLSGEAQPHWARDVIAGHGEPVPLDYLSAEALAPYHLLMMAQPRGLTAQENVALDAWVRGGGRLLLFADPMMTGESRFHIGDRRRPQDVALLSPILGHWGLELFFDPGQEAGLRVADSDGKSVPVNMRGAWRHAAEADRQCVISGDALLARCQLGRGKALLVADAALLDIAGPYANAPEALHKLIEEGLGTVRESRFRNDESRGDEGGSGQLSNE